MNPRTEHQNLPDAPVEVLDDLDILALRVVRAHVDRRLDDLRSTLFEIVRSKTGSEVVDITDSGPHALVGKYRASGDSSGTGRRARALCRGAREKQLNGEGRPRWSSLGDVTEPAGVECGNCGVPPDNSTTVRPQHDEERSRDEGA